MAAELGEPTLDLRVIVVDNRIGPADDVVLPKHEIDVERTFRNDRVVRPQGRPGQLDDLVGECAEVRLRKPGADEQQRSRPEELREGAPELRRTMARGSVFGMA